MIALLAACATEPPERDGPQFALDDPAFRFCHVPGAHAEDARVWCELLPADASDDRCPGLRATCDEGVVTADPASGCAPDEETDEPVGLAGEPVPFPPERRPIQCEETDTGFVESLLRWVTALGIAAALVVLARVIWGTLGRGRGERRTPAAPAPVVAAAIPDDDLPSAPSADLLALARSALLAGRPGDAVRLARAAALRNLGERGRLTLHRARTDREYLRALRADVALEPALRMVVDANAVHRWGGRSLPVATAELAVAAAERIVFAVVLLMFLGSPAHGGVIPTPHRYAPQGDAALLRLFELHGFDPGWRLPTIDDLDGSTDVLVLDLWSVPLEPDQWDAIVLWVNVGGILLVGGDATPGFPELGSWEEVPEDGRAIVLLPPLEGSVSTPVVPFGPRWGFTGGEAWAQIEGTELGFLAVLDVGAGRVAALSDPRLLWNGAWVHPDNESFLGDLPRSLGADGGRLQLATEAAFSTGSAGAGGAIDPIGALSEAHLLPFVLQALATWTLLALWQGWPFGRPKDEPDHGRRAFVEHVHALGTHYYRLGASGHARRALAELWLTRLGPQGLEWAAARAGYPPDAARRFAESVAATAAYGGRSSDSEDLERMEELWRVTRGGR